MDPKSHFTPNKKPLPIWIVDLSNGECLEFDLNTAVFTPVPREEETGDFPIITMEEAAWAANAIVGATRTAASLY